MAHKTPLPKLISEQNLTAAELAEKSGVSAPTARRAVRGDGRLNTSSATKIASALDAEVDEINWPGGLVNNGRPAGRSESNR